MIESDEALLVLGSLSQCPMDIWQLASQIQFENGLPWTNLTQDHIYRILEYLRREHLIEWSCSPEHEKRVYQITETGRDLLARWLKDSMVLERPVTFPFDLIVNAFEVLPLEERHWLIERRKAVLVSNLKQLNKIVGKLPEHKVTHNAILQHHQVYLQAELKWLDKLDAPTFDGESK